MIRVISFADGPVNFQSTGPAEDQIQKLISSTDVPTQKFSNKICLVLHSWKKLQKLSSDKFCSISTLQNDHSN